MAFKEETNAKRQKHREKSRELCALKQKIKIKKKDMVLNRETSGTLLIFKNKRKQLVIYGTFPIHILEDPELWPPGSQSPQIGQK